MTFDDAVVLSSIRPSTSLQHAVRASSLTGRRQIPLFVAAKASHAQRIMGTQNDVGGKGRSVEGYKGYDELVVTLLQQRAVGDAARGARRRRRGVSLREGLNDVVVLAFQLQYVCSKGIYHIY